MIRRMRSLITYVTSLAKDTPPQAYLPHHSTEQFLYRSPSNLCTLTSSVSDGTWIYCPSLSNALRIGKNCSLNDSTTCWSISSISVVVGGPPPVLYRLTYANTCSIQYRLNSNIWHRMLTTELSHTHPHTRTLRHTQARTSRRPVDLVELHLVVPHSYTHTWIERFPSKKNSCQELNESCIRG